MDTFQNTGQPDWDWWGRLWPTPGATLRRLGVASGDTVAEIACGNGYFSLPAARITEPNSVYALDIDESLLDELTALAERQKIENVVTLRGDARELTRHLPEPVDALVVANTFHGIEDRSRFVEQAFEAIRPGGQFVIINWHDLPRETTTVADEPRGPPTELRISPDETAGIVRDAAEFDATELVELPPYHYAIRFER
ncbi:class I SAM-dependent methyltransferase [Natrinema salinisoli]|uniref:class I SAM-dependent methyltransferase n=1 Tax=Natrinema salinisoli TaxID=2878535 RepID=UPI001CF06BEC|nr:class I SAM-dependent methyltransferase [Natrinema salinisoli]